MMNATIIKQRFQALVIDFFYILAYLLLLFIVVISFYHFVLEVTPLFDERTSQWISFLTTVFPIIIFFSIKEAKKPYASPGKKKVGLRVFYRSNPIRSSVVRNTFKFLPWQFGHFSVIRGIYDGFDSAYVLIFYGLAVILPIVYILMVLFRKDHQHLPDLVSGSWIGSE